MNGLYGCTTRSSKVAFPAWPTWPIASGSRSVRPQKPSPFCGTDADSDRLCSEQEGIFFTEAFDLPRTRVSQEEILALLLDSNLLSKSTEESVFQCTQDVSRKLIAQTEALSLSQERIE